MKKNPRVAAVLSFFVPGAGLWYVGRHAWGALNLTAAIVVPTVLALVAADWFSQYLNYVLLAIAAASAGLAHAVALQRPPNAGSSSGGDAG